MKRRALLAIAAQVSLAATAAAADPKVVCTDAALTGQTLRAQHRLVEAREQFRTCAQSACPALVLSDCGGWLAEVERAVPTVVITAKDDEGHDVVGVTVSSEGQTLTSKLAGESLALNPGLHTLHFEDVNGRTLDHDVLVKEGVKNQQIAVVLPTPHAAPATSSWRTVGWVGVAAGVIGVGAGLVFGLIAVSDKSKADCNSSGVCLTGPLDSAKTAATASTVSVVAGGVLAAGGVVLVLLNPKREAASSPSVGVAPVVGARDLGLVVGGRF